MNRKNSPYCDDQPRTSQTLMTHAPGNRNSPRQEEKRMQSINCTVLHKVKWYKGSIQCTPLGQLEQILSISHIVALSSPFHIYTFSPDIIRVTSHALYRRLFGRTCRLSLQNSCIVNVHTYWKIVISFTEKRGEERVGMTFN